MNDEFTDISLARPWRSRKDTRTRVRGNPPISSRDLHITDAVFADFAATTLRRDEPAARTTDDSPRDCSGLVEQLSGQLQALDQQRGRLSKLLNDLQTPHSTAI